MHYMLVTSITLPLQAASNGRNYMHYMAHYMLSKMLMDIKQYRRYDVVLVYDGVGHTYDVVGHDLRHRR